MVKPVTVKTDSLFFRFLWWCWCIQKAPNSLTAHRLWTHAYADNWSEWSALAFKQGFYIATSDTCKKIQMMARVVTSTFAYSSLVGVFFYLAAYSTHLARSPELACSILVPDKCEGIAPSVIAVLAVAIGAGIFFVLFLNALLERSPTKAAALEEWLNRWIGAPLVKVFMAIAAPFRAIDAALRRRKEKAAELAEQPSPPEEPSGLFSTLEAYASRLCRPTVYIDKDGNRLNE